MTGGAGVARGRFWVLAIEEAIKPIERQEAADVVAALLEYTMGIADAAGVELAPILERLRATYPHDGLAARLDAIANAPVRTPKPGDAEQF